MNPFRTLETKFAVLHKAAFLHDAVGFDPWAWVRQVGTRASPRIRRRANGYPMIIRLKWISSVSPAGLKRTKSIANGFFRFHVVPSKRVLESGDVTACTGLVKLDVKIHDCVHGREGGHEHHDCEDGQHIVRFAPCARTG